jgi:hypothetical protein
LAVAGHDVVGLARSTSAPGTLAVNALDRDAVFAAVRAVRPDAVVNMLTAIPARLNAARECGVRRILVQGIGKQGRRCSRSSTSRIVDDDPVPIRDWLPEMAEMLDAPRPRRLPLLLVRLAAGGWGAAYLGGLRGPTTPLPTRCWAGGPSTRRGGPVSPWSWEPSA